MIEKDPDAVVKKAPVESAPGVVVGSKAPLRSSQVNNSQPGFKATKSTEIDPKRLEMFTSVSATLWAGRQSSFESFDKAILTLSSGALAISIAFMKDVVPIQHLIGVRYLVATWICFVGSLLITLLSFFVSQRSFDFELKKAEDYYIANDEDARERANRSTDWVGHLNKISGMLFIFGVGLTIWFVATNVLNERTLRTQEKNSVSTIEEVRR